VRINRTFLPMGEGPTDRHHVSLRADEHLFTRHECHFALTTALAIGGIAAAAGGVASSAIGSHAAGKAADAQVKAANHAADIQHQDAQAALAYQKQQDALNQKNMAPWLQAGQGSISSLYSQLKGGGFPDWTGTIPGAHEHHRAE
jgi:hypothetical protein